VKEYNFGAMVALDPSAHEDALRRLLDGMRPQCVVGSDGRWFPAAISVGWSPSHGRSVDIVVRARLLAGEPEAFFFAAGQPFAVWADAIVDDHTVRGEGRLGDGVIMSREFAADEAARTAARPAHTFCRTIPPQRRGTGASLMAGRQ
jgi:hypothetical protein